MVNVIHYLSLQRKDLTTPVEETSPPPSDGQPPVIHSRTGITLLLVCYLFACSNLILILISKCSFTDCSSKVLSSLILKRGPMCLVNSL